MKKDTNPKSAKESKTKAAKRTEEVVGGKQEPCFNDSMIWGAVLVAVGLMILLSNLGILELDISKLWQLWPLLIVMTGLSLLKLRGWLSIIVSVITTTLIIGLIYGVLSGSIGNIAQSTQESFTINQINSSVERAEVEIETGAGSLDINSHEDGAIATGGHESQYQRLQKDTLLEGNLQKVKLTSPGNAGWWLGSVVNDMRVSLTRSLPLDLRIDAGAVDLRADLSQMMVDSIEVDSGASKVWLKLGSKHDYTRVDVDTGASSVEVLVPLDSGVRLEVDSGLSSQDLPDGVGEIGDGIYQTADYDKQNHKIDIKLDMGVSSFKLITY